MLANKMFINMYWILKVFVYFQLSEHNNVKKNHRGGGTGRGFILRAPHLFPHHILPKLCSESSIIYFKLQFARIDHYYHA